MSTVGSSVLSESKKIDIRNRDNSCVVCGYTPETDVAHIVARNAISDQQLFFLRNTIRSRLSEFRKDDYLNLILLCPNHHRGFGHRRFVLIPSPAVRRQMIAYEQQDFEARQSAVNAGRADPGRMILTHPELPYEFEYIPTSMALSAFVRMPTHYDNGAIQAHLVDHRDILPNHYMRFTASHYALLVESFIGLLGASYRVQTPRCLQARTDVAFLRDLYERVPTPPGQPVSPPVPEVADISSLLHTIATLAPLHPTGLHSIPEFTGDGTGDVRDNNSGFGDSTASDDTRHDLQKWEGVEISESDSAECASAQLDAYQAEPAVTVEAIKTRPFLDVGQGVDPGRFKTSADWCTSPDAKCLP